MLGMWNLDSTPYYILLNYISATPQLRPLTPYPVSQVYLSHITNDSSIVSSAPPQSGSLSLLLGIIGSNRARPGEVASDLDFLVEDISPEKKRY